MRKLIYLLTVFLFMTSCLPSPRNVKEAVGKGEIDKAVTLLIKIVNKGEITDKKLNDLLGHIAQSHNHFKVDSDSGAIALADTLMLKINDQENKRRILPWYVDQYLLHAEGAMQDPPKGFNTARIIWRHYQKERKEYFPKIKDSTPVLAVIDLREADYLARKRQFKPARELYNKAKKQLTQNQPFDLLTTHDFKDLALSVDKALKKANH